MSDQTWPPGGGECGALIRAFDWTKTSLGPVENWSPSLRSTIRIMLDSHFGMRVMWGPELTLLYNDAYRPVLGENKHPHALGARTYDSYVEVWDVVGPLFHRVLGGEAFAFEDLSLPLNRQGMLGEAYFTLSYSPVRIEDGTVGGVFGVVYETTARVLTDRRLRTLRELAAETSHRGIDAVAACLSCTETLAKNPHDVPFSLLYLKTEKKDSAALVARSGIDHATAAANAVSLGEPKDAPRERDSWPFDAASEKRIPHIIENLEARFGKIVAGPHGEDVTHAIIYPLIGPNHASPFGWLVIGINPRCRLDDAYRGFLDLCAEHVTTVVSSAIAEEVMLAERSRLLQVFLQAPLAVALLRGEDFKIELANDHALKMWGKKREIVVGKPFLDGFPEMRGQNFDGLLRNVVNTNTPFYGNEALARLDRGNKDLDEVYINFVYAPFLDRNGKPDGILSCGFEVTEQVLARRRLESLAGELASQKHALEEAHRMKDEFLATMSHELRTPLNAILGWARLLQKTAPGPEQVARALEVIERNAAAQVGLVEDLLDISRIISGKLRLHVTMVDLPKLVENAIETFRPAATAKDITVHAVIDSHAGPVTGDEDRLVQITSNLLSNAIKFSSKGSRLHVHLERVGSSVRLTVRDQGSGISPDFLPFVFERFRQADQAITRRHGGLGIGLSIVRHLVELHGGTVSAASEGEGKGATFTVLLPVAAVNQHGQDLAAAPISQEEPGLDGVRVLIIDDELDARELMTEILLQSKATVISVSSAAEAFIEIVKLQPHVIICDVGMPVEDGYSFMRRLRALPPERGGRTKAAAITAYVRSDDRRRALAAGFNLHLGKPIDPSELVAAVTSLAERYTPVS